MLTGHLFSIAQELGWNLQAWAIFSDHYHLVASKETPDASILRLASKLHTLSAIDLNKMDGTPGRRVWYRSRDTALTYEKSYYARLAYVLRNPVKHGLVAKSTDYQWCSAAWFDARADLTLNRTVNSFKTDQVNVDDDFEVLPPISDEPSLDR